MKFKKEDIGLYFAFALVGGGLGLLVGAILTSWLEKRAQEEAIEKAWSENEGADEEWAEAAEKARRADEEARRADEEAARKIHEEMTEDLEYKVKKQAKEKKRNEKRPNKSQYTDEALEEFFAEYQPNVMMMEMLRNGGMNMEQVIGVIEAEEEAFNREPVDYSAPYHEANVAEAEEAGEYETEELKNMGEDLGIVNGRFQIRTGPPDNASDLTCREIQWDSEDNSFYMLRRGNPIGYDIRTGIGHDTWEVIAPYLLRGMGDIFVVDLEKPRYYSFHKLAELGEDDPVENGSE